MPASPLPRLPMPIWPSEMRSFAPRMRAYESAVEATAAPAAARAPSRMNERRSRVVVSSGMGPPICEWRSARRGPFRFERHDLPGPNALIGRQDDAEAVHRVVHVIGQVDVVADRAQEERLLAIAQPLVIRLVFGADVLVGLDELVGGVERRAMQPETVRLGVAVDVGRAGGGRLVRVLHDRN